MTTEKTESNQTVRRACAIFKLLAGRNQGRSLKEIATAIGAHDSTTLRVLCTLQEEGFVTQYPKTLHWALSLEMMQIAQATESAINRDAAKATELRQRIHAGANQIIATNN